MVVIMIIKKHKVKECNLFAYWPSCVVEKANWFRHKALTSFLFYETSMKKTFRLLAWLLALLVVALTVNTLVKSRNATADIGIRNIPPPDRNAANHLQQAVGIPSVSFDDLPDSSAKGLDTLIGFLHNVYPEVFRILEHEIIADHSLLLRWKGKKATVKKPVLLYAHMDVVPVEGLEKDSLRGDRWRFNPFKNQLDGDTICGRGTIDDKLGVIGILEAVNRLIAIGFQPERDIYIAFGSDEEIGGTNGAGKIAAVLEKKNIRLEWMLDEGGMVAEQMVPFVDAPVALVMTAEKGYMTVELSVKGPGGHSSFPPKEAPIDILASAIMKLKSSPFESRVCSPVDAFMDHVGPEMKFPFNVLFANRWLFTSLILNEYGKIAEGNAMIRTTTAFTRIEGGVKENMMPTVAAATVNFRILPGEDSYQVIESVKQKINDDRVVIRMHPDVQEPAPVASTENEGFKAISHAIHVAFPDAVIAPGLSIGATDSRHFGKVAMNRYRFLPVRMNREILSGMHGINERIPLDCFMESIRFYETLLKTN